MKYLEFNVEAIRWWKRDKINTIIGFDFHVNGSLIIIYFELINKKANKFFEKTKLSFLKCNIQVEKLNELKGAKFTVTFIDESKKQVLIEKLSHYIINNFK